MLGALGVVAVVVGVVLLGRAAPAPTPAAVLLHIGDCFLVPGTRDIAGVQPSPCTQSHTGELFATVPAPQSADYPKPDIFLDTVFFDCGPEFVRYTGVQSGTTSHLTYSGFWPTEAGWKAGDRVVYCYLTALDGSAMTQSYKAK